MNLTQILTPTHNSDDIIATNPDWTRTDFNNAVFKLSRFLQNKNAQNVALWFDDAAQFACALLAVWHSGANALLLPNLSESNIIWAKTADVILTDIIDNKLFSDGIAPHHNIWNMNNILEKFLVENAPPPHIVLSPQSEVYLKTSASSGEAQIIAKTVAQLEIEAQALAKVIPFGKQGAYVIGSVLPQHMYGLTFRFALSLSMGWTIIRHQAVYPETLLAQTLLAEKNVIWITSPAMLNRLGETRNWPALPNKIVGIVSAGGALPESTANLLAKKAIRPFEIYGSTETGVIASRQETVLWQPINQVSIHQEADGALIAQSPWTDGAWHSADIIETQKDGFTLLGRKDRIIKFEDKRVSLTQIEHQLLQHPWIADAHCGQHPQYKRIAVWAALNQEGIHALCEQGRTAIAKVLKKYLAITQDTIALPRYWRFTDELPRNAQSKITAVDFQTALCQPSTAPLWTSMPSENSDTLIYKGKIPLDLIYFNGHFADFPLVPGVIELQWISDLAAQFTWGKQSITRIENLKYQQFIRPNDEVIVELKYDSEKNKLNFKISNQEAATCASGRIVFKSI